LFELTDAVLCAPGPVCSLPRLSLEPVCRRGHGSGYAALAEGRVNAGGLADLLAARRPARWPLVFAVDATAWPRVAAETSPGRGLYYHPSRQANGKPVVAGWCYQLVSQLNFERDSWTWPVDARRIHPREDALAVTVAQVRDALSRLGEDGSEVPLFVFDAGSAYDPAVLSHQLAGERVQLWCGCARTGCSSLTRRRGARTPAAGPAATARCSTARTPPAGVPPACSLLPLTRSTAWSPCVPGPGCTRASPAVAAAAAAGPARRARRRSCAAR